MFIFSLFILDIYLRLESIRIKGQYWKNRNRHICGPINLSEWYVKDFQQHESNTKHKFFISECSDLFFIDGHYFFYLPYFILKGSLSLSHSMLYPKYYFMYQNALIYLKCSLWPMLGLSNIYSWNLILTRLRRGYK